jgi:hypothetical protein
MLTVGGKRVINVRMQGACFFSRTAATAHHVITFIIIVDFD